MLKNIFILNILCSNVIETTSSGQSSTDQNSSKGIMPQGFDEDDASKTFDASR